MLSLLYRTIRSRTYSALDNPTNQQAWYGQLFVVTRDAANTICDSKQECYMMGMSLGGDVRSRSS